jgi:hypothetical protein
MIETCGIYIDKIDNTVYKVMGHDTSCVHLRGGDGKCLTKRLMHKPIEYSSMQARIIDETTANVFYNINYDPDYNTKYYEIIKGFVECGIVVKAEIFRESNVVDDQKIKSLIITKGLKYAMRYKCVIEKRAEQKAIRQAKTTLNKALKNKFRSLKREGKTVYLFSKIYYNDVRDRDNILSMYVKFFVKEDKNV